MNRQSNTYCCLYNKTCVSQHNSAGLTCVENDKGFQASVCPLLMIISCMINYVFAIRGGVLAARLPRLLRLYKFMGEAYRLVKSILIEEPPIGDSLLTLRRLETLEQAEFINVC